MNTLAYEIQEARARDVSVTEHELVIALTDGRTIIVPLVWYPRLWYGNSEERSRFEIIGDGRYIHWPDLDEDLSVAGILAGRHSGESPESLKRWLENRAASKKLSLSVFYPDQIRNLVSATLALPYLTPLTKR